MMKKAIKRMMAAALAIAMLCVMAVPAFAATVTDNGPSGHTYTAYQIFTGTQQENKTELGNVQWGSGINAEAFYTALKNSGIAAFATLPDYAETTSAAAAAKAMEAIISDSTDANAVAKFAYANIKGSGTVISGSADLDNGYYLFVDTTENLPNGEAYNAALLQVTGSIVIRDKSAKPTVTKTVHDNDDGSQMGTSDNNNGFGKSADHAINESFQFKLEATLPASENFSAYKGYKVVFHDTMSAGITFEQIDSVVITSNGTTYTLTPSDYTVSGVDSGDAGKAWTLTIDDIKTAAAGIDLTNGAVITVLYSAHLNENAVVNNESGDTTNQNKVLLEYSNNPNADGTGKTNEEEVYVFSYQVNNTKYKNEAVEGNELEGAEFRLYSNKDCTKEVKLYKDGDFYYPIKDATGKTEAVMVSGTDGKFNIKGLDAGIYYLRETKTPDGFNTCADIEIVIGASHVNNHVTLDTTSTMNNNVINNSGATLPSTGGIGTTIFYVVGGGLMVAAVILLVTKKRMENK